ncbi:MAG: hypothetical protein P8H35_08655 [Flavobacteriales bacterium]|nr:hypothetical protein [Flavobacteriales bacterium]
MPKHIYDDNGNYKGKILSDEEHESNKEDNPWSIVVYIVLILLFWALYEFIDSAIPDNGFKLK